MTPDRNPADDLARRLAALEGDGLDGVPPTAEEIAAARRTAHALGELADAEAAEVERALADQAASAQRDDVEQLRELAARLRTAAAPSPDRPGPTGSPTLRTAVTAALATRGLPKSPAPAPSRGAGRSRSVLALVATGGLAASALVALLVTRDGPRPPQARPGAGESVDTAPVDALASAAPAADPAFGAPEAPRRAMSVAKAIPAPSGDVAGAPAPPPAGPASPAGVVARGGEADEAPLLAFAGGDAKRESLSAKTLGEAIVDSEHEHAIPADGAVAPGKVAGPPRMNAAPGMAPEAMSARARGGLGGQGAARPGAAAVEGRVEQLADGGGGRRWFNDRDRHAFTPGAPGTDRYARFIENSFRDPSDKEQARSTFSIDVDTASYAIVRRFLNDRQVPPPEAVRLEEMLNYFRYDDPAPHGDDPLAVRLESAGCPWQPGHRLLRVALKGRDIAAAARPGTSLVFLVDVSGSMNEPNKLPLVKQSLSMLVDQLTENDKVAIVTYAGDAGVKLPPTSGDQKPRIRAAIDALSAGGSTNGSAGIEVAYRLAQEAFVKGGSNRVLLATDGDLNVGITDDAALVGLIREKAGSGVFLTVLGFGQGNLQDEKMEKLADNGNGIYAYVDGAREARKVLVEQLTGSTVTIAKDVKIQIEFNPARVAAYRLLGYENRLLAARDFKDDTKDAGEVGAGHGVTALYEIVPVAAAGAGGDVDPLKYQPTPAVKPAPAPEGQPASPELCTVKLRWKAPEASESVERAFPHEDAGAGFEAASTDLRFAAAVAEFGMLLRESRHRGRASLEHVASTASGALGHDPGGLRAEFLDLVREAGALLPYERRGTPN